MRSTRPGSWRFKVTATDLLPALSWLPQVNSSTLRSDLFAGLTNAAVVLPQAIAFAAIAGLPPEYGLYAALITPIVAALFGSSMIMVSGPTTAISAVVFASLQPLAEAGTAEYIALALYLTLLVGLVQFAFGLAKLGKLAAFVSHSVMLGFTAAAAVLIGVSQFSGALGVTVEKGGSVLERAVRIWHAAESGVGYQAPLIAAMTVITTILVQKFSKRVPAFLVALIAGTLLNWILGADNLPTVGHLPSIFPSFSPAIPSYSEAASLANGAVAIALIGILEAVAIGRALAARTTTPFRANQEIIGQGLSNIVGSMFHAYPGSGSFTRSGVNFEAGAKTPLSAIFSSLFLLLLLLVVAPLLAFIPIASMAGLILVVAWRLIDRKTINHVWKTSKTEFGILAITFLVGILVELELSIFLGVILSLTTFITRTMQPKFAVGAPDPELSQRTFRNAEVFDLPECPQLMICRFDGPLYFGSVEMLEAEFRRIEVERPGQKFIGVNLKGVGDIDLSGVDAIITEARRRRARGGDLYVISRAVHFMDRLRELGLIHSLGEDHVFPDKHKLIKEVLGRLDNSICATCDKRVFLECKDKPSPKT